MNKTQQAMADWATLDYHINSVAFCSARVQESEEALANHDRAKAKLELEIRQLRTHIEEMVVRARNNA